MKWQGSGPTIAIGRVAPIVKTMIRQGAIGAAAIAQVCVAVRKSLRVACVPALCPVLLLRVSGTVCAMRALRVLITVRIPMPSPPIPLPRNSPPLHLDVGAFAELASTRNAEASTSSHPHLPHLIRANVVDRSDVRAKIV